MKKLLSVLLVLALSLGLSPVGAEYVPEPTVQGAEEVETLSPAGPPNFSVEEPPVEAPTVERQTVDTNLWRYVKYTISGDEATITDCEVGMMVGELTIPDMVEGVPVTAIGARVFWNCEKLTKVTLPSTLTRIGAGAFYACGITEITIPDSVVELGEGTFSDSQLAKIILSANATELPTEFCANTKLTQVTIPKGVKTIGEKAFFINDRLLESIVFEEGSALKTIKNSAFMNAKITTLSLPDGLDRIEYGAFWGSDLTTVTIPASVTYLSGFSSNLKLNVVVFAQGSQLVTLGESAFADCTALLELNTPLSLRTIEHKALAGIGMTKIVIPEGVVSIGDSNFVGEHLTSVSLPASLTELSTQAFSGGYGVTSLTVSPNNPVYSTTGDGLFSKDGKALLYYIKPREGTITLPEGLERIGSRALAGDQSGEILNLILPSTLKQIDPWAFQNNANLRSINIPAGVTTISNQTFFGCTKLSQITLHDGITEIQEQAFGYCDSLTQIDWPEGLKTIGKEAFRQLVEPDTPSNRGLKGELTLPPNLETIGEGAFYNCQLTKVNFPASLRTIEKEAFCRQTQLQTITGLAEGLKYIGDSAFAGGFAWDNLTGNVVIPDSVTYLGVKAFENADLLSVKVGGGITKVPDHCFSGNPNLRSVTLPETITVLGQHAFSYCGIETIDLPSNLTEIENGVFSNCTSLKKIILPDSLLTMESGALSECTALTTIRIPKNLTADNFMSVLTAATKLEAIEVAPENTDFKAVDNVLFTKDGKSLILYPPARSGTEYTVPEGTEEVWGAAFCMVSELKDLTLPSGPAVVKSLAIVDCPGIRSLTIPAAVTLQERAVEALPNLTELRFEEGIETIRGFWQCKALTSVTIPGSVTLIGEGTFRECTGLRQVTFIEGQPLTIEKVSFSQTALESVILPGTVGNFNGCFGEQYDNLSRVVLLPGLRGQQAYSKDLTFGYSDTQTKKHIYLPSTISKMPEDFLPVDMEGKYTYYYVDPGSMVEEFLKKQEWKNYTNDAPPDPWQLALGVKDGVCSARAVHLGRDYTSAPMLYLAAYRDGKLIAIDSQTPTTAETFCTLRLDSLHGVTLKAFLLNPATLQPVATPVTYDMV